MVPVHVPLRPLGKLVSLVHVLLAMVAPETYSRKSKLDQQMTQAAIQQRNNLVPKLIDSLKALQLWIMGSGSSPDRG
eukprot:4675435-Amphidinium_carterae.3